MISWGACEGKTLRNVNIPTHECPHAKFYLHHVVSCWLSSRKLCHCSVCFCVQLVYIQPLTQPNNHPPRSQILKCWQTSNNGRLGKRTGKTGGKEIFLLQALLAGCCYCHSNITWWPGCGSTELHWAPMRIWSWSDLIIVNHGEYLGISFKWS